MKLKWYQFKKKRAARVQDAARRAVIEAYGLAGGRSSADWTNGFTRDLQDERLDPDFSRETLATRSLQIYQDGGLGRAAIENLVSNAVGTGLKLDAKVDGDFLGLSRESQADLEKDIEREWDLWASSLEASTDGTASFYSLQALAITNVLLFGDTFVLLENKGQGESPLKLSLRIIDGARVRSPFRSAENGNKIVDGVEVNQDGRPVAYYIHNSAKHGGDKDFVRVANSPGKPKKILHLRRVELPGQVRGTPVLAPVIQQVKQLTRYQSAEVTSAVVSALFTAFIRTDTPDLPLRPSFEPGDNRLEKAGEKDTYSMGAGTIISLRPGEDIVTANPGRPNPVYPSFVQQVTEEIGASLGIPYEILTKHFSSSYSASRGAIIEAKKTYDMLQDRILQEQFIDPIYTAFLSEAVARGRLALPGFFQDPLIRQAWKGAEWYGRPLVQLDPVKEARAAEMRVESGFSTRAREAAQLTGEDYDRILPTRIREEEDRRAAGLAAPLPDESFDD